MKDASMSLGIYFEIKDSGLYGGEGTTGYAATIVEISIEGLQNANFEKYANSQLEAMASNGGQTCSRALYLPALRQENTGRPHALSLVRKEALLGQRSIRRPRLPAYEREGRQKTMIIQLEIPKEFAKDYANNRFDDFFRRVYADIDNEGMCGNYEGETAQMMARAFKESRCLDYEKTR